MGIGERDYRDDAVPVSCLNGALALLDSGDDFIPAWAFATLFIRSKGEVLTKQLILDETAIWVGLCQLGHVGFKPFSRVENIPTMAQLPQDSEFALKKNVEWEEALISLPNAIAFAEKNYKDEDVYWIKQKIAKASGATPQTTKPRKKLKQQERDTNQGLLLVYQIANRYNVQYLDELPASKAWANIVSGDFISDLIIKISESKRSITLKGGENLSKEDFSEKYRKRFIVK